MYLTNMLFDKIKSLSQQSLIYGLGYVLSRFLAFLLLPFYSHLMPPEEYGALVLVYMFIAVMQIIYIGGLDIAFLRFYVAEPDETKKRILSNCFLATGAIALLLTLYFYNFPASVISIMFDSPPVKASLWVRIASGILLLDTLSVIPLFRLRGEKKATLFAVIKLSNVVINIAGNIVLVGMFHMGLTGALYANLISAAAQLLILLPFLLPYLALKIRLSTLKELWRFGLPNVPAMLFLYIIEFSDRKIIELTCINGLEEAGLYSAGYKMGMFMAIITTAFRFAWQPFFLSEAKNEGAEKTFARIFTYFFLATGFLFMLFVMFAADLLMMKLPLIKIAILDPGYWQGMAVFPVILLAHFFDGLYANFTVGIYIKKKTKLIPVIIGAGAVFNLSANILVIPRFGMMGAAWTTLGSFILMAWLLYTLINRHYPIPYEWGRILKFSIIWAIVMAIYFAFTPYIWVRFLLILIVPIMLYFANFFNQSEINRLKSTLKLAKDI